MLWRPDDGEVEPLVARMREIPGHVEWKYYSHDGPELRERLLAAGLEPEDEETVVVAEARLDPASTRGRRASPRDGRVRRARGARLRPQPRLGPPGSVRRRGRLRRRAAGLGRAGRLRGRRRVRGPVRRHHAARVPRARALSRDGRASAPSWRASAATAGSTPTRCRRAGRSSSGSASSRSRRRRRSSFLAAAR